MNMIEKVSCVKEKYPGERRVFLQPKHIKKILKLGVEVLIERDLGSNIGISNEEYKHAGATIVSRDEAWNESDMVLKYKVPIPDEYKFFREGLIITGALHAEGKPQLVNALCGSKTTAYSYEYFKTDDGIFPMMVATSEIAGKLAVIYGAFYLQSQFGGSGVLLSDIPECKPPKVLVIGYGNAGGAAAKMASDMGADVIVLGTNKERIRRYNGLSSRQIRCEMISRELLIELLPSVDLVIGAVQISTYDTAPIIDDKLLSIMKKGSMIVDVTCGYGKGYLPTFDRKTDFNNPVYIKNGILHCAISTLPAAVASTSMEAIGELVVPYMINLIDYLNHGKRDDSLFESGLIIDKGIIVNSEVRRHYDYWISQGKKVL